MRGWYERFANRPIETSFRMNVPILFLYWLVPSAFCYRMRHRMLFISPAYPSKNQGLRLTLIGALHPSSSTILRAEAALNKCSSYDVRLFEQCQSCTHGRSSGSTGKDLVGENNACSIKKNIRRAPNFEGTIYARNYIPAESSEQKKKLKKAD